MKNWSLLPILTPRRLAFLEALSLPSPNFWLEGLGRWRSNLMGTTIFFVLSAAPMQSKQSRSVSARAWEGTEKRWQEGREEGAETGNVEA